MDTNPDPEIRYPLQYFVVMAVQKKLAIFGSGY